MIAAALLFDMDGVLVDSLPLIERILRRWAVSRGVDADEAVRLSYGRRDVDVIRLAAPELDAEAEARWIVAAEEEEFDGITALPGAAELLAALDERQWAVVTSATGLVAKRRLEVAGLAAPAVLLTAEDVTAGKPDPEGYLLAAQRLGAEPAQCVVFEDAVAGARAARAGGMRCVGVGTAFRDHPDLVDLTVGSLAELKVWPASAGIAIEEVRA